MLVYMKDRIIPVKIQDVAYFYSSNERVVVGTRKGEEMPLDKTLDAVMGMLSEDDFFRANRQFVIARDAIEYVSVWFGNRLSVTLSVATPEKIVVSKAKVAEFKKWMSGMS